MVRRRVAAGIGVVLVIVIVLIVNGCLKSEKQQALKEYNQKVSQLAQESDQVSRPLFAALAGAGGKSALNVEVQIDQLRTQAQELDSRVKGLSVPGEMASAQRNLLLVSDLRVEGLTKIAALLPTALGGQGKQASTQIAGDMEIFLTSDVIYSQRVAPLIQQALAEDGIHGLSTASTRFLPNIGWLEPATALARISGQSASSTGSGVAPGHHGSALKGVSVGSVALEPEPTLNHIPSGSSPTFTVLVEDAGEFPETNVKTNATVTAAGKQYTASHIIEKTEPGKTVKVDIPVVGVPVGAASKVEVAIEPVPGETNHEDTKSVFVAIFEK
jgi:outer membrane murein-binding lipoprotein Lpp